MNGQNVYNDWKMASAPTVYNANGIRNNIPNPVNPVNQQTSSTSNTGLSPNNQITEFGKRLINNVF